MSCLCRKKEKEMPLLFPSYEGIIPEFPSFLESLQNPCPTHLRINKLKVDASSLVQSLGKKRVSLKRATENDDTLYFAPGLTSPGNLLEYFLGYIHPQALTSCLASIALSPREGSYVLDMCAAPGGKTSHLAQLMSNTGLIIANELSSQRHLALGHTLARLGSLNTVVTDYQAQQFPLKQCFDYVLADVPCSGEGRFRRTKEHFEYRHPKNRTSLPDLQQKIILRGFDLLKDDGEMLYSTCTYNPEENESVVDFLLSTRDAELLSIDVGMDYESGVTEWKGKVYDKRLSRAARFYPHRIDSVGFFMARIGRRV
jgi:NOL1/NOP2/sun family putative RNA methylase